MQKWISFFLLLMITEGLIASDSIPVVLNAKKFSTGDTLEFSWNGNLIGKGYAADRAKALLMKKGIKAGIINASGDLTVWGLQPNGNPWQVAITNPLNKNQKTFF